MGKIARRTINGTEFKARTLTLNEILDILKTDDSENKDPAAKEEKLELFLLSNLFEDSINPRAFLKSLDISFSGLDGLEPEDIKILMEAVAEANPTLAEMEKRMASTLADTLKSLKGLQSGSSRSAM